MSIKRRIWALPAMSTIILSLGLAVSVYFSTDALRSIRATEQVDSPAMDSAKLLSQQLAALSTGFRDMVAEGDQKLIPQIQELGAGIRSQLKRMESLPGQAAAAQRLGKEFDDYFSAALGASRVMLELDQGNLETLIPHMQSSQQTLERDVGAVVRQSQQQFATGIAQSSRSVERVLTTTILVVLATVICLVVVSYFVVRTIWQQLGGEPEYARSIARAVADGDLSMHIEARHEHSVLAALKDMQAKLTLMIADVKESAATIATGSEEIASGNANLSARTEAQASSLEETASAMETLTQTVKQNADSARQANGLAGSASGVALKGGDVVRQVIDTMADIHASSSKISDITAVIDGIAFQTNILALNAAVEAARAGEQGRGFAVVASEVRNLAQRSAAAAREIKALINDSVGKVTQGSTLVDQAGRTMTDIVDSVKRVTDIMAEIASASEEQSNGIAEVSNAVRQMDDMTQQNAALVEEAAAATESMQEQAQRLSRALDVFRLLEDRRGEQARALRPAAPVRRLTAVA